MADLSAIVVNFNSGEYLAPCLESLARGESAGLAIERVVIENASTIDQSAHLEQARRLGARVIRSDKNLGYGGGCNLGLRETSGRFVLFLNADVKACAGCLAPLVDFLEAHDDVAFVEPRTYADDALAFRIPEIEPLTPGAIVRQSLARLSSSAARRLSMRRTRAALPGWRCEVPRDQETLTGAFLMGRRETVVKIGGFDEAYPLWFEDTDLFRRCRRAGLRLVFVPQAAAIHYAHRSVATAWNEAMAKYRLGRRRWLRTAFGPLAPGLDRVCEGVVRAAERIRRPPPFLRYEELGACADEPELRLHGEPGPFLLELAIDPGLLLAAGHFGDGASFRFPEAAWRNFLPARYYARALDPASLAPRGAWTFNRTAPAPARPSRAVSPAGPRAS